MIILDLFFFVVVLFFLLPVVLGVLVWFKVRTHVVNPFQADNRHARKQDDAGVIEGQYEVVEESQQGKDVP